MTKLTARQKAEVELKLVQGALSRASTLSLFFALSFSIYGITSFDFLGAFDPDLTLWSNVWPRLIFNGLPFLAFHFAFRNSKTHSKLKLWVWSLGFPVVFLTACLIHAWPLIWSGHTSLYLHVHAANFLVLIMAMTLVSAPPQFLFATVLGTIALFIAPLAGIFIHLKEYSLLRFFLQDACYGYFLGYLSAHMSHKLREGLEKEHILNRRKIESFVGNLISKSIFEKDESLLRPRQTDAFIMSIDVRGFTSFVKSRDARQASLFKESYHRMVARLVGSHGGFIHKTHGDGHLITLGLMNHEDVDLSDVPGLDEELRKVEHRKHQQLLDRAVSIFDGIYEEFDRLKEEMAIDQGLSVCAAIDFGEIGLKVLGDPNVRLEFDVEGMVVIRCARLEAYTKTLREVLGSESSYLILSSRASDFLPEETPFQTFSTLKQSIKDFPDEVSIAYKEYRKANVKKSKTA